ncbi:hypothetical protein LXL04_018799 [Taraxacum kok-saghyz]
MLCTLLSACEGEHPVECLCTLFPFVQGFCPTGFTLTKVPEFFKMDSRFVTANERVFWGGFFVIFGSIFFGGFLYTAVISKLLPHSDNAIISAIQNDRLVITRTRASDEESRVVRLETPITIHKKSDVSEVLKLVDQKDIFTLEQRQRSMNHQRGVNQLNEETETLPEIKYTKLRANGDSDGVLSRMNGDESRSNFHFHGFFIVGFRRNRRIIILHSVYGFLMSSCKKKTQELFESRRQLKLFESRRQLKVDANWRCQTRKSK